MSGEIRRDRLIWNIQRHLKYPPPPTPDVEGGMMRSTVDHEEHH